MLVDGIIPRATFLTESYFRKIWSKLLESTTVAALTVVVGQPERVGHHRSPGREDDEVGYGHSRRLILTSQHYEDAGILRMSWEVIWVVDGDDVMDDMVCRWTVIEVTLGFKTWSI